jgi:hypothetical protein
MRFYPFSVGVRSVFTDIVLYREWGRDTVVVVKVNLDARAVIVETVELVFTGLNDAEPPDSEAEVIAHVVYNTGIAKRGVNPQLTTLVRPAFDTPHFVELLEILY